MERKLDLMGQQETKTSSNKFSIIEELATSKFPIFLIYCYELKRNLVLKLYPYEKEMPKTNFLNESRFMFLNHPSIISFRQIKKYEQISYKQEKIQASYIIMDYAANGDFSSLMSNRSTLKDERVVRTYFHQLIEGIEYLHSQGVAHMDLKLGNLLLDENYMLKIADFDVAYKTGDWTYLGIGTTHYRAPEVKDGTCIDPFVADIYSAGVILFNLLTGCSPYLEDQIVEDTNYLDLLRKDSSLYWAKMSELGISMSEDAQNLFSSMVREDPVERATLYEIKSSKWYSGEVYSNAQLKNCFSKLRSE